jgi:hypothetical protein
MAKRRDGRHEPGVLGVITASLIPVPAIRASEASETAVWGGVEWAFRIVLEQAKAHGNTPRVSSVKVDCWTDQRNVGQFTDGQWGCEILYHRALPPVEEAAALRERWLSPNSGS